MPPKARHDRFLNGLLADFAARLVASGEDRIEVGHDDLGPAPLACLDILSQQGLLALSEPAGEVVCDGCERACLMPAEILVQGHARQCQAFIVCDKRDDIGRVPIDPERLRRWSFTFNGIAGVLATLLGTDRPPKPTASRLAWNLGAIDHCSNSFQATLCPDGRQVGPETGIAIVLHDRSQASEQPTIGLSQLLQFDGHQVRLNRAAIDHALKSRFGDSHLACEIKFERGEIILINYLAGNRRTIATPNFNSSNDNAFQVLYANPGRTFSLEELRDAAREPSLASLHKFVENLNFEGVLKTLFFRVSKNAIRFDRTTTVGQLRALEIDPREVL